MVNIQLRGSRITKITAERNENFDGKIDLKTNLAITSTEKEKAVKDVLNVSYRFEVDYGDLGGVGVEGSLFISADAKTLKEIQKASKEQRMESEDQIFLVNLIMQKANVKCFELEEELGLPIHVRLPTLTLKEQSKK